MLNLIIGRKTDQGLKPTLMRLKNNITSLSRVEVGFNTSFYRNRICGMQKSLCLLHRKLNIVLKPLCLIWWKKN